MQNSITTNLLVSENQKLKIEIEQLKSEIDSLKKNVSGDHYVNKLLNDYKTAEKELIHYKSILEDLIEFKNNDLDESETRLKIISENISDLIIQVDLDYKINYASVSILKILGYKVNEIITKPLSAIHFPSGKDNITEILDRVNTSMPSRKFNAKLMHKNGRDVWMNVEVTVLNNKNKEKTGWFLIYRDTTIQKNLEKSVKSNLEKFKIVFENHPLIMFILAADKLNFIDANSAALTYFDITSDQLINKNILDFKDFQSEDFRYNIENLKSSNNRGFFGLKFNLGSGEERIIRIDASIINLNKQRSILMTLNEGKSGRKIVKNLSLSEAKHWEMIETLPICYAETDLDLRVVYLNKAGTEMTGYDKADIQKGIYLDEIFPEQGKVITNFEKALKGERKELKHYLLRKKDGTILHVMIISWPIIKKGQLIGIKSTVIDITQNYLINKKLEKSEEKFRQFAQLLPETIFEIDLDGNFLFLNESSFKVFGYSKDDRLNAFDLVIPEDLPKIRYNMQKLLNGGKSSGEEYTAIKKDGNLIPILLYAVILYDKNVPVGFRGIIIDMTERKKAELALFESEEKYRSLASQLPVGIYRTSASGKVIYGNPALSKILGYEKEEELYNVSVQKHLIDPSIRNKQLKHWDKAKPVKTFEYKLQKKDGTEIWVRDTYKVIFNKKGEVDYFDGIIEDITDQKELEEQLKRSQKLQSIGTLAGGIAHDFNNILMGMQIYTELSIMGLSDNHPMKENLQKVLDAQIRAKELIKQILTFSSQSGELKEPLLIHQTVMEGLKLIKSTFPASIELKLDIQNCGKMYANPAHIHQIIMNLCTNANHAMNGNGILSINLEKINLTESELIKQAGDNKTEWIRLSIGDTGIGMDKKVSDRIFDPFFTTKKIGIGTGLGLATVHGLVKEYNGEILFNTELGKGTTFYIYLPVQ